jgi:hypothetical protein
MDSIRQILTRLSKHDVEFVIIGGVAAILHGSARATLDVDVCAALVEPNLSRILQALRGTSPKWRMHPGRLPLPEEPEKLQGFRNLYLETDLGILDILTEVAGIGSYEDVVRNSMLVELEDMKLRVLDLDALTQLPQFAIKNGPGASAKAVLG